MIKLFFSKNEYLKNIKTVTIGTVFAQALPIAVTPVLTRFYSPEDFGVFGFFIGIVALLSIIANAKFDVAIIQPKDDKSSEQLLKLCFFFSLCFSLLLCLIVIIFFDKLLLIADRPNFEYYIYFIPVSVFVSSSNNALTLYLNRNKHYRQMSVNLVIRGFCIASISLVLGLLKLKTVGLVLGYLVGNIIIYINLFSIYCKKLEKVGIKAMKRLMKQYKNYPMYSLPSGLSNTASAQMPVILLTNFFSASVSGFYYLVEKFLSAPITLLGEILLVLFFVKEPKRISIN